MNKANLETLKDDCAPWPVRWQDIPPVSNAHFYVGVDTSTDGDVSVTVGRTSDGQFHVLDTTTPERDEAGE